MTNEELLQQAKDQHAKKFKVWGLMRTYRDWKEVESTAPISQIVQIGREAALLAIQSAREEAAGKPIHVSEGLPEKGIQVLVWIRPSPIPKIGWLSDWGNFVVLDSMWINVAYWHPLPKSPIELTAPGR